MPPERIHVVEDEDALARTLGIRLRAAGYEVERSGSAEEALESHDASPADAIILDVRLPGMDGLGFLEQLGEERVRQTPIIVASANHQDETARRALELGAVAFVGKPYRAAHLLELLHDALSPAA